MVAERGSIKAHAYARECGVSKPLYRFVRLLTLAVLRLWFRVRVSGAEHIPAVGPVIIAPNHKNFLDAFFVGLAFLFLLHQSVVVARVALRASWLARALRGVDGALRRARS